MTATHRFALLPILLAGLALAADPTGSLSVARFSHTAVRMYDGRVLIAGGHTASGSITSQTRSVEIYDPAAQVFSTTGLLNTARGEHASVLALDGRVLVFGGLGLVNGSATELSTAEAYDPALGVWTTLNMTAARRSPQAISLLDGRVLVIGGGGTASCELFDPYSNTFTATAPMSVARGRPALALLPDGRVLVAGGVAGSYLATTELFDPVTETWTAGPTMAAARYYATATALHDGRVLIAGGFNSTGYPAMAELYSPSTNTFSSTPSLVLPRQSHAAAVLQNGNVVLSGGTNSSWTIQGSIELYDVAQGTWRAAGVLTSARNSHTATPLVDGKVLFAGGSPTTNSANLFDPACADPAVLSPASFSFGADAVTATIDVTKTANCAWSVTSSPSWVSVTAGSGVGNGTITFNVASNRGNSASRSGSLQVSEASASLTQASDPCLTGVTSLSPSSASFTSSGGSSSVSVTPPSGCAWAVTSVPSWVTLLSGAPGSGPGILSYSVASNSGSARSATMRIGTANFVVSQAANACIATISPASQSVAAGGGSGSISVSIGAGCSWSTTGAPSWMTITSGLSGTGPGSVTFTVAANTGAARSANLVVAGNTFTLSQAASGSNCNFVSTLTAGSSYPGTLSAGDCNAGARGASYWTDRYSFNGAPGQQVAFLLTSTGFDTYLYLRNPSGTVIASNDDGGGGTNSRIPASSGVFTLPAGVSGTFVIEVTSYSAGATGAYTLQRIQ